jgi:hypothetical protein
MDYLEFIARVTFHIPDKGQVMVRYYGLYSNARRGKMPKREVAPSHPLIIEDEQYVPSRGWAEMIKKVYEVDHFICPNCHGQMKVIAFITDYPVVDRIIRHLKLSFQVKRPSPPPNCAAGTSDDSRREGRIFLKGLESKAL